MERTAQYLVVIYALEREEGSPVRTGRVARSLGSSSSATTEMIRRLADDGLVEHEPYAGVTLTDTGREQAVGLYETHETLCRFFCDVLDLDEHAREALSMAGIVDAEMARRLKRTVLPRKEALATSFRALPLSAENAPASKSDEPQTDGSTRR